MKLKVKFKEECPVKVNFSSDDQIFHTKNDEIVSFTGLDYETLHNPPSINEVELKVKFKEECPVKVNFSSDDQIFHTKIGEIVSFTGLDYETLHNLPSINGVELIGNKTSEDLHLGGAVFPSGGSIGDVLGIDDNNKIAWITLDSGTVDYNELINRPQINGITLSSNQSATDLGLGTYTLPSDGIPITDLAAAIQSSLNLADSALQSSSVDSALSSDSINPVQNKIITQKLNEISIVGLPSGGTQGQLLMKSSNVDYITEWITPANAVEQDNTRPITAAAVYTEVGNIQALLAII